MKISVIVPVYNVEKYIRQCLDSIVNQSIGIDNIEVIVVNDATPDSSMDIVDQFRQRFPDSFKIISNEVNMGLGESRNIGTAHATSDYITYIDSDDFIDEDTFKNSLDKMAESSADLLIYSWTPYIEGDYVEPPNIHRPDFSHDEVVTNINLKEELVFFTSAWNKIFHKSLIEYIRFPKGLYEDNSAVLEAMFNAKRIYLNSEPVYHYRKNPSSITEKIRPENVFGLSDSIEDLFELARNYPQFRDSIMLLIIKFASDVLFWIYYYDWYSFQEIEMFNALKNSFKTVSKKDLEHFFTLFPDYEPNYFQDISEINNLDCDTFIAKYKYYKPLPKVSPTANLYIDTGEGFSEDNKISVSYSLGETNKLTFNLKEYQDIRRLRFDPIEGAFIMAKILSKLNISGGNFENSLEDDYQIFTNLDPSYLIDSKSDTLEIEFKLAILSDNDLADLFSNKNNIINELRNRPKKGFFNRLR